MRRSFCAARTIFESSGMRRAESRTTRSRGRRRRRPLRSVSSGVVGEDGVDAGEDGVGLMAERLDGGAGLFAGDPVGFAGCA